MTKKKLAIIGASYLQEPLIRKAKERNIETHVFAWQCGDIGEKIADFFYPISIVEKDEILNKCKDVGIDGICSIASDLATVTVSYVADKMGLVGNSLEACSLSTNKYNMRKAFFENNDPSPKSVMVSSENVDCSGFEYPVIIKPLDRSGSRGITLANCEAEVLTGVERAIEVGFEKKALVEEYATGDEYSIECVSYKGQHTFLAITQKYTTGAPNYIETGHIEPPVVLNTSIEKVKNVVFHALDSLKVEYGASHSEVKIDADGNIKLIEIGARMGGDFIGSDLVYLSTGYDFVNSVIDIALGQAPKIPDADDNHAIKYAAIHFVFTSDDIEAYQNILKDEKYSVIQSDIPESIDGIITDSSNRKGYFIYTCDLNLEGTKYMPKTQEGK